MPTLEQPFQYQIPNYGGEKKETKRGATFATFNHGIVFRAREYSPTFEKIEFDVLVVHDFN